MLDYYWLYSLTFQIVRVVRWFFHTNEQISEGNHFHWHHCYGFYWICSCCRFQSTINWHIDFLLNHSTFSYEFTICVVCIHRKIINKLKQLSLPQTGKFSKWLMFVLVLVIAAKASIHHFKIQSSKCVI